MLMKIKTFVFSILKKEENKEATILFESITAIE